MAARAKAGSRSKTSKAKAKSKPARKSSTKKPSAKKPAGKKPAPKKPAAKKQAATKARAKRTTSTKTPTRTAVAKKPATPRTVMATRPPAGVTASRVPVARARAGEESGRTWPRLENVASTSAIGPIGLPNPDWLAVQGAGDERRRFRRVPKELKIRLFASGREGYLECYLKSADMSLSGIFLRSTFFLAEGTDVRIEFDAPWGQTASATGVVARIVREGNTPGFGIRFKELDEEALTDLVCIFVGDHIQQFVEKFLKDRGSGDRVLLAEGILAWELQRLSRSLADDGTEPFHT